MGTSGFLFCGHFIAYYGLMIVIGIVAAAFIAYVQIKRFHLDWNDFLILCGMSGLFGIAGAKILYLLISIPVIETERLSDLSYVSTLMNGGFVFYGGLIGVFPALYLCKNKLGISVSEYLQYCIGCIPIVHGFGRIGCYLVGCCHGIPYDGLFSVTYSDSRYAPNGVPLLPVQLLEAFGEFGIGMALLFLCKRQKGISAAAMYMTLYSVMRFFLEYLRGDIIRGSLYNFSTSQYISVAMFIIGLGMRVKSRRSIKADAH